MKSALVTAIGSFSADIVIKNLKKIGFNVIGCDIYPKEWIVDAYQVNQFYQAPYANHEQEYLEFVQKICIDERISMILPLTDVEIDTFNRNRKWFEQKQITLCISSKDTIDICRNKIKIEKFIRGEGAHKGSVRPIPTHKIINADVSSPFGYPVVCKLYDGRSSQGLRYIHSENEWREFIKNNDLKRYIAQPFIEGSVVTVDIVRDTHGNCAAFPRKELLRTLNGAGTSVYVFSDVSLEQQSKNLANQLNIIGCVNFEFIIDTKNQYHFVECNPRFSGGVEFSCIAGYDCVANHIKAFQGNEIDSFTPIRNQYIARKYEEYVTSVEQTN